VSVDAGIKLTLGNVDFEEDTTELNRSIALSTDAPEQTFLMTTLQNTGSLDGKIGYKIDGNIPPDIAGNITLALYEGDAYVADLEVGTDKFLQKNGETVVIEPGNQKVYSIKVTAMNFPSETENIELSMSFSLTQTNATEPKQMFYDLVTFDSVSVALESEAAVPVTGWPTSNDPRWKTDSNTGVRYINELESEIMYFSETKDGTRIKNLDNLSIYIDYSKSNQKWNIKQILTLDAPFMIKEVWSDGKLRIDVSLDADANQYIQSTTIGDYDYEMKFQFQSNSTKSITFKGALFAKRLLLTSDNADYHNNANYYKDIFPVYTSKQGASIHLAYIQNNTYSPLTSLSESTLQLSEYRIRFDVQKVNSMIAKVDKSSNSIKVKVADHITDLDEIKRMSIFITGSSGQELKIERNVKALPIDLNMEIPIVWNDLGGQNKIKISSQQLDIQLIEKIMGNKIYFVNDPAAPPVMYLMNAGNHYVDFRFANQVGTVNGLHIEKIVYSPDMKIMRITFSFESETLPDGFNFSVSNGINNIISDTYYKFNFIRAIRTVSTAASAFSTSDSLHSIEDSIISEEGVDGSAYSEQTEAIESMEPEIEVPGETIVPVEADSSEELDDSVSNPVNVITEGQ